MTKGFVTIATGDERYFELACNLLHSYKHFSKNPYPFAILTDKNNKYTEEFDDVIVLEDTTSSYMDKLKLLLYCPYDETIFIDADCLAYKDLNCYWNFFSNADDFSCFGKALPLTSKEGWFNIEDIGEYSEKISFIPQMHGGICFIRKGEICEKIYKLCIEICNNYGDFKFKYFDKPADEPILALSSAVYNCKPTPIKPEYYIFYPCAKTIKADILNGKLSYTTENYEINDKGILVHWQNVNTKKALYKFEVESLDIAIKSFGTLSFCEKILFDKKIKLYIYKIIMKILDLIKRIKNKLMY